MIICLATLCSFAGCENGGPGDASANVNSSDSSSASEIASGNVSDTFSVAEGYRTDPEYLYGVWQIEFYSYDNNTYAKYRTDISEFGFFTFYADGTAAIQFDENDTNIYHYEIAAEKSTLSFSDIDTGTQTDFYFGYSIFEVANENRLLISDYNAVDHSVIYLILSRSY